MDEEEREEEPGVGGEAASATSCRLEIFCATSPSIFFGYLGVCSKYQFTAKSVLDESEPQIVLLTTVGMSGKMDSNV